MNKVLYVSSVPSEGEFNRIKMMKRDGAQVTIYGMNESGYKFHTLIMKGMCNKEDVEVYSVVGRSVNFHTHKGLLWKTRKEHCLSNLYTKHIGFVNLPVLKHLCIGISCFFTILAWLRKNRNDDCGVVLDAAYISVLPFVMAATGFIKCHKSAIFCDIYEYMGQVKDANSSDRVSIVTMTVRSVVRHLYRQLDSFVLLTEEMNSVVNPCNKPYIIMEGLVDVNMAMCGEDVKKVDEDVIMYAGAIREQYGVKTLLEGFSAYRNPKARLWIFGDGDYVESVVCTAKRDERIKYWGSVPINCVVENELRAKLLINPRPNCREFAKYSFPSKNMEYMVSGTPVLTTKLPGMPKEYHEYVFTIDGNESQDITKALEYVFSLSEDTLKFMGDQAKRFVLEKKNNFVQAKRILDLLRGKGNV